jgi:hypothetical protein
MGVRASSQAIEPQHRCVSNESSESINDHSVFSFFYRFLLFTVTNPLMRPEKRLFSEEKSPGRIISKSWGGSPVPGRHWTGHAAGHDPE